MRKLRLISVLCTIAGLGGIAGSIYLFSTGVIAAIIGAGALFLVSGAVLGFSQSISLMCDDPDNNQEQNSTAMVEEIKSPESIKNKTAVTLTSQSSKLCNKKALNLQYKKTNVKCNCPNKNVKDDLNIQR